MNFVLDAFSLSTSQLEDVRAALRARLEEGLARDGAQLKALPAYLAVPDRDLMGTALVIDIGGTNVRAAIVELQGGGRARVVAGPLSRRLPLRDGELMGRDELFGFQARLARELSPEPGLPVGYCFSYPSASQPNRDARLLRWTKGLRIPGVEGTLVGSALSAALAESGVETGRVTVLNDTVAAMLAGSFAHGGGRAFIGLIVGTGTNMATFFPPERITKLGGVKLPTGPRPIAVNLESGNFHPPHLTELDQQLDLASDNPGEQRFEKAVSGHYLPLLYTLLRPADEPLAAQGTKALVDLRDRGVDAGARAIAAKLLERSADLVSGALAAVIDLHDPELDVGIIAEGGLFWNDPEYAPRVSAMLGGLLGTTTRARIYSVQEANLVGSAAAALGG